MKSFATFAAGLVAGATILFLWHPAGEPDARRASTSPVAPGQAAPLAPQVLDEEAVRTGFFKLWSQQFRTKEGIWKNTWFGIPTLQNPLDVWITQEILHEQMPDFVVETGTFAGGSAALWATILEQINPDARVITIDITDDFTVAARKLPIVQRKVDFLLGSSTDPAIVDEVKRKVGDGKVVVILDSLHTRAHVLDELRAYAPLVPVGGYVIVQDTGIGVPAYGMNWAGDAVRDFLAENDGFEVDLSRERFMITNNARGFLKRVR